MEPKIALVYAEGLVDPADLQWWGGPLIPVVMPSHLRPIYALPLDGSDVPADVQIHIWRLLETHGSPPLLADR